MAAFLKTLQGARLGLLHSHVISLETGINLTFRRNYRPKWVAATLRELKRRKDIENDRAGGEQIFHRSTFLEWNYDAELFAFENRLGEKFNNDLLRAALTHKSYLEQENARLSSIGVQTTLNLQDNEALASKGEELINKFVKGYLRAIFFKVPEEFINSLCAHLTSTSILSEVAKQIGIGDLMLCSDFPCQPETYLKSFKAIVAALEESSGEEKARVFVQDFVVTQLYGQDVNEIWNPVDPVGILNSILKRENRSEPEFRLLRQAGPNTILASYNVGVYCEKVFLAEGAGESIAIAQEMAARNALKSMFGTEDSMKALPFGRQLKTLQSRIVTLENRPNVPLSHWTSKEVSIVQ